MVILAGWRLHPSAPYVRLRVTVGECTLSHVLTQERINLPMLAAVADMDAESDDEPWVLQADARGHAILATAHGVEWAQRRFRRALYVGDGGALCIVQDGISLQEPLLEWHSRHTVCTIGLRLGSNATAIRGLAATFPSAPGVVFVGGLCLMCSSMPTCSSKRSLHASG